MPVTAGSIVAFLELDTSKFTSGFKGALSDLKVFTDRSATASQKIDGLTNSMSKMGGMLTAGVTVPLVGIGTAAVKTATDFEAAMSNVRAISGATGADFKGLEKKAIELGASTTFSATEVANAMTEMAKAGWDSQQIMDGMGGVLDAAAASGEELATVSTIVADSITTFGLAASESTRVADLLAQSANAGTINITDLGESIKYIGPVAKTMGFEIEDVVTAITALSTAGIKGSQAGTTLRSMFARLVKPTDDVKIAMNKLGITLADSEGNFYSMNDILEQMRSKFSKLTPEQQTYYATVLAGQEGMSGLTALLSMTQEEYDKISVSMKNAAGTAERTADVMQDNLAGAVEQLGGALESAGITLGKRLTPYIRDAAEVVTDLTEKISEMSDEEIESAVQFAAMAAAIGPTVSIASKLLKGFTTLGRGIKAVSTEVKLFTGAVKLHNLGMEDMALKTSTSYRGLASLKNVITSLNPYTVALTAGVVALTAAVVVGTKRQEEYRKQLRAETEEEKALTDAVNESTEARKESQEAIQSSVDNALSEAKANENLANKLAAVVDENGRVIEGKQIYAEVIAGQLSDALGIEIDLSDGQIDNYSELSDKIYKTIDAKKALAVQEALSEQYNEALAEQIDAQKEYNDTLWEQADLESQLAEARQKLTEMQDDYNRKLEEYGEATNIPYVYELNEALSDQSEKVSALEDKLKDNNKQLQDATENYEHWNQVVQNYEGLSAAIIEGDANKINLALVKIQQGFLTAETATRESLEKQKESLQEQYDSMVDALERGSTSVNQEMIDQIKTLLDQTDDEIVKSTEKNKTEITNAFKNLGIEASQSMVDALSSSGTDIQNQVVNILQQMENGIQVSSESLKIVFSNLGIEVSQEMIDSLASMEPSVQKQAVNLISQLQYGEESKREEVLQQLRDLGVKIDDSLAEGITSNKDAVDSASSEVGASGNKAMQTEMSKTLKSPDVDSNTTSSAKNEANTGFITMQDVFDIVLKSPNVNKNTTSSAGKEATSGRNSMQKTMNKNLKSPSVDSSTSRSAKSEAESARSSMQSYFDNNPLSIVARVVTSGINAVKGLFDGSHADGLDYVPYDGYIAELHKGERVLTADENRAYNAGVNTRSSRGGDVFNFYNTQPDPYEYARQMKKAKRDLGL